MTFTVLYDRNASIYRWHGNGNPAGTYCRLVGERERETETETETERDILRGAGGTCLLFFKGELGLVLEVPVAPAFCFLKPKQD